jgi:uncharacterized protein YihD (DUF1040 family)
MARDKERIDEVLESIEEYWRENPDLRLSQIICNVGTENGYGKDPFYMEDSELVESLEKRKGLNDADSKSED